MKKILLTGGGTAGHVTPNLALLPALYQNNFNVMYVGSRTGIEKKLVEACGVPYFAVSSGKLRRYFDLQNVRDAFRIVKGLGEAYALIRREKPDVVFSKGGFVTVPVVVAARLLNVPVVIHESDLTPGLANKLSVPFAKTVCVTFPETASHFKSKAVLTGTPIRRELFEGDRNKGLQILGFSADRPVVLIIGGSSGSVTINRCVEQALPRLLKSYQIAHIRGEGNVDETLAQPGYRQFAYLGGGLPHVLAACDVVVSRAGANAVSEFLALQKPALLIPLSRRASRGDQILNAESFKSQGFSFVLAEEELTPDSLSMAIIDLYNRRGVLTARMAESVQTDGVGKVMDVILDALKN